MLDLFCGAGGAAMGYHRAGFDVIGVDIASQPRYPFEFVQADALTFPLEGFDVIHASPPCQDYSKAMRHLARPGKYPRLIDPIRDRIGRMGNPFVIENVVGAPLPTQDTLDGAHGIELCGSMFGLRIFRHRIFETSFGVAVPRGCNHECSPINPENAVSRRNWRETTLTDKSIKRAWCEEMGVDWMSNEEASEAIPPAYTEYIGRQLLEHLTA